MNILVDDNILFTSTLREDMRLSGLIEMEYDRSELEEIANIVYTNRNISTFDVLDLLFTKGYNLMSESDIDYVMQWLWCFPAARENYLNIKQEGRATFFKYRPTFV